MDIAQSLTCLHAHSVSKASLQYTMNHSSLLSVAHKPQYAFRKTKCFHSKKAAIEAWVIKTKNTQPGSFQGLVWFIIPRCISAACGFRCIPLDNDKNTRWNYTLYARLKVWWVLTCNTYNVAWLTSEKMKCCQGTKSPHSAVQANGNHVNCFAPSSASAYVFRSAVSPLLQYCSRIVFCSGRVSVCV